MTISETSAGKKNDSEVKITVNVDVGCDHFFLIQGEGWAGETLLTG